MSHEVLVTTTEAPVLCLSVESHNKEMNDVIKFLCLFGGFHIVKVRFL